MLDLAFIVALSSINQHIPCSCTGVCVGVLMGMYEWIASIDRSLQQLWANGNCLSCKVQRKWGLKSWTWSRAPGKPGGRLKGEWHVQSAQEGEQFSEQCFRFAWGVQVQKQGCQSGGLLERPELYCQRERDVFRRAEEVSLFTWGRARIGLWIHDHKATEPGLRNVTGSEGKDHIHENVSQSSFSPHLSQSSCPFLGDRCSLLFRGICYLEWKCTSSAYSS